MTPLSAFQTSKELDKEKKRTRKMEIEGTEQLLKKIVMPNFNKLSETVRVAETDIKYYGPDGFEPEKTLIKDEPYVVIRYNFKDMNNISILNEGLDNIYELGYLLGINKEGKFIEGSFIKDHKVKRVKKWVMFLGSYDEPVYQRYKMQLKSQIVSMEEFLEKIPFESLHELITKKLELVGISSEQIKKEKAKQERINRVLATIKSVK